MTTSRNKKIKVHFLFYKKEILYIKLLIETVVCNFLLELLNLLLIA